MEGYYSREIFGFVIAVLVSTKRPNTAKILLCLLCNSSYLPHSSPLTYLLLSFHISLLFSLFIHNNDDYLGHKLAPKTTLIHIRLYKRYDLS